jgi:hypothetical protein
MNIKTKLMCFSLATLMGACAPAGYYDSNGVYRSYGQSDSYRHDRPMTPAPAAAVETYPSDTVETTTIIYTRPGYYDRNGDFIAANSGPRVPAEYFPPRGMCRVWFTGRPAQYQPAIESCTGIQSRVPADAYVVYGG